MSSAGTIGSELFNQMMCQLKAQLGYPARGLLQAKLHTPLLVRLASRLKERIET